MNVGKRRRLALRWQTVRVRMPIAPFLLVRTDQARYRLLPISVQVLSSTRYAIRRSGRLCDELRRRGGLAQPGGQVRPEVRSSHMGGGGSVDGPWLFVYLVS